MSRLKGSKLSEEHKRKISEAHQGKNELIIEVGGKYKWNGSF